MTSVRLLHPRPQSAVSTLIPHCLHVESSVVFSPVVPWALLLLMQLVEPCLQDSNFAPSAASWILFPLDKQLLNRKPLCCFLCTWLIVLLSIPERQYCSLEQPTTIPFSSCLFLSYFYVTPLSPCMVTSLWNSPGCLTWGRLDHWDRASSWKATLPAFESHMIPTAMVCDNSALWAWASPYGLSQCLWLLCDFSTLESIFMAKWARLSVPFKLSSPSHLGELSHFPQDCLPVLPILLLMYDAAHETAFNTSEGPVLSPLQPMSVRLCHWETSSPLV